MLWRETRRFGQVLIELALAVIGIVTLAYVTGAVFSWLNGTLVGRSAAYQATRVAAAMQPDQPGATPGKVDFYERPMLSLIGTPESTGKGTPGPANTLVPPCTAADVWYDRGTIFYQQAAFLNTDEASANKDGNDAVAKYQAAVGLQQQAQAACTNATTVCDGLIPGSVCAKKNTTCGQKDTICTQADTYCSQKVSACTASPGGPTCQFYTSLCSIYTPLCTPLRTACGALETQCTSACTPAQTQCTTLTTQFNDLLEGHTIEWLLSQIESYNQNADYYRNEAARNRAIGDSCFSIGRTACSAPVPASADQECPSHPDTAILPPMGGM